MIVSGAIVVLQAAGVWPGTQALTGVAVLSVDYTRASRHVYVCTVKSIRQEAT